jgi:hypothetical protein
MTLRQSEGEGWSGSVMFRKLPPLQVSLVCKGKGSRVMVTGRVSSVLHLMWLKPHRWSVITSYARNNSPRIDGACKTFLNITLIFSFKVENSCVGLAPVEIFLIT